MKLHKILFPITLIMFLIATGLAYSQDVVIPADTEDIEAFDKALMKHQSQLENRKTDTYADQSKEKKVEDGKTSDEKKSQYAKAKEDETGEEISKEAKKMKNLDKKSRKRIKEKIPKKAHANAQEMEPKESQNPADVVSPPQIPAATGIDLPTQQPEHK